jgi:hypothetical protein
MPHDLVCEDGRLSPHCVLCRWWEHHWRTSCDDLRKCGVMWICEDMWEMPSHWQHWMIWMSRWGPLRMHMWWRQSLRGFELWLVLSLVLTLWSRHSVWDHYTVSSRWALHSGTTWILAWTIWDGNPVWKDRYLRRSSNWKIFHVFLMKQIQSYPISRVHTQRNENIKIIL